MVAIDREVGGSTMIRVSMEVRDMIEEEKIIPREPLNDCIKRMIIENRENRCPTTQLIQSFDPHFKLEITTPTITEPIKIEHGNAAEQIRNEFTLKEATKEVTKNFV